MIAYDNINEKITFFASIIGYNRAIISEITLNTSLHYSNCILLLRTILTSSLLRSMSMYNSIAEIDCDYKCIYHQLPLSNFIRIRLKHLITLF